MAGITPYSLTGFMSQDQILRRSGNFLPMHIGIYGQPSGGKTELALSAPGLITSVTVDRGHIGLMLNPNPPKTRNPNSFWRVIDPPMPSAASQNEFVACWQTVRDEAYRASKIPEVRTLLLDGDSETWEIQRMAEFGKLTQVPSHMYTAVNAARKAYYAKLQDSGKFVIWTNRMAKEYVIMYKPNGEPELDDKGRPKRQWSGRWERKGFSDMDYSLVLGIHCYRKNAEYDDNENLVSGGDFAASLELCKSRRDLEGTEFAGVDCNLQTILREVYPHIPLKSWGY